jgi:hypothetical protein
VIRDSAGETLGVFAETKDDTNLICSRGVRLIVLDIKVRSFSRPRGRASETYSD